MIRQPKVKNFLPFLKLMKCSQIKFHTDTMSDSKVIRSKKSKFFIRSNFLSVEFLFINILLKLQQHIDMLLQV